MTARRGNSCLWLVFLVATLASLVSSARTREKRRRLELQNSHFMAADPSEISEILYATAKAMHEEPGSSETTPFQCGTHSKDVALLAEKPLVLHNVGKLAKGGNFLVSEDRRVLVKAVASDEATSLRSWVEKGIVEEQYTDCETFENSLLLPVPLLFKAQKPFIVMFNKTAQLEDLAGSDWRVKTSYDIKPLPNLSKGLLQILKALLEGWGKSLPKLSEWLGWEDVRMLLARDLNALEESNVVDYSFFVHLIVPTESATSPPPGLRSRDGCIQEPTGKAIVCFHILDFLTAYSTKRHLESSYKGGKFNDYAGKVSHAFDCFGDLTASKCSSYKEYVSIKEDAKSKAERKVFFMGTATFREHYECKLEEPYLMLEDREGLDELVLWAHTKDGRFEEDDSYSAGTYAKSLAKYLSDTISLDEGAEIVGDKYSDYMEASYDFVSSYDCALNATTVDADTTFPLCKQGVYDFATLSKGWVTNQRIHTDLGNVIWNPEEKSVLVVRGAPQYSLTYSHSNIMAKMLKDKCVMKTRFFRCKQISGHEQQIAKYDYKVTDRFKDFEILQVFPGVYNEGEFTPRTSA